VSTTAGISPRQGARAPWRQRRWAIVAGLSVTETVSWGILYYAFAIFLLPLQDALDASATQVAGALSVALLISAVAGLRVGRFLDRHSPRALMTTASVAGALLVAAWSQVDSIAHLYLVWAGIGVVMACVLYEPAFVVLAKHFHSAAERRLAMTIMTLAGAFASFIFLPLSHVLLEAHGWRTALLLLAAVLAVTTIPLHALVLRAAPPIAHHDTTGADAGEVLRSVPFRLLTAAFFLGSIAGTAAVVLAVPTLAGRGFDPGFAAFAVGLVGLSQIPGRLLFAPLSARLPATWVTASMFALMGGGIAVFIGADSNPAIVAGLIALGMGNGMSVLSRATLLADRYGAAAYGRIAGVTASTTTLARAIAPVAGAAYAGAVGYPALMWTLAGVAAGAAGLAVVVARTPAA
jgi:MFS family permease